MSFEQASQVETESWIGDLRPKLNGRFVRSLAAGGIYTGGSQLIRLVGNLALTRLLFPEAFGLMALVNVFIIGLEMFSDLGVGLLLVQRSERPELTFIQTAWTVQAIRGVILWLIASAVAWPLALFYSEPALAALLPVAAFSLVLTGFKSPAAHLCARDFHHGAITRQDLLSAVVGLLVSIGLAVWYRSVWALVAGGLMTSVLSFFLSWRLPGQVPVAFRFHRENGREIVKFGRWIYVSTVFAFLAANGDRLLLGKFLSLAELGVYTVAFFFAQSVTGFVSGLASRALLPIFSRLESGDPLVHRYRRFLMSSTLLPLGIFLIGGPLLIQWLYDPRYAPAGAMLQVLALGAAAAVLRVMAEPVLLACGDTFSRMILGICEAVLVMTCVTIGGLVSGLSGLIVGFVVGQFFTLIPTFWLLSRHDAWAMRDDFLFLATALLLAIAGWTLHPPSLAFQ